ncbi:MAG TPA: polysaccharide deacetylase family protein [Micromonosporaceae bacterium]|nr:polysaccharide deacetylase family protein [Micromonosporaceae bacterium]
MSPPAEDPGGASHAYRRRALLRAATVCAAGLAASGCDAVSTHALRRTARSRATVDASASARPSPSTGATLPRSIAATLPPEVRNGPRNRPGIALTFHGQGTPPMVRDLLIALEDHDARGTFMAVGSWLASEPMFAARIRDGGHELGNHTMHHLAIASMNRADASAEIDECADVLRRLTGSIGTWFRPSQTQFATPTILAAAARAGYPTSLSYDVDSLDYTDPGVDAIVATVLRLARNGSIVSMHAGHAQTVAAVPTVLAGLRHRGLRPMTMTELMSQ